MNNYSKSIILLLFCLLMAACFRHQGKITAATGESNSKVESRSPGDAVGTAVQPVPTNEPPGETPDKVEHLQGYTFRVPDHWEVVHPDHFLDVPDRWEIAPLPSIHYLYLVYKGQNQMKARFCVQAVQEDKDNLDADLFNEIESKPSKMEEGLRKHLHADTVKRIESAHQKANGVDALWLHFAYSSPSETGDIVFKLLRKGGSAFGVIGTFSSPMYSQLQQDITAVLDSIKKE